MLLDDNKKAVEYFVENILAGTINVELLKLAKLLGHEFVPDKDFNELDIFVEHFHKWINLRKTNPESKEFVDLTNTLFYVFMRGRLLGFVTGVFKEISELEHDLAECKGDNVELAMVLKEQGRIIASYEAGMHKQT